MEYFILNPFLWKTKSALIKLKADMITISGEVIPPISAPETCFMDAKDNPEQEETTSTRSNPPDSEQQKPSPSDTEESNSKPNSPRENGYGPPFGSSPNTPYTEPGLPQEKSTSWNPEET